LRLNHLSRRLSRESWPIAIQPISFMSRSNSAFIRPSARSTPAWPAAAKGWIIAADPNRLGADRERLKDMRPALHPAVHEHVDPITYGVDDFGQLVERCPRAVELSAAMV